MGNFINGYGGKIIEVISVGFFSAFVVIVLRKYFPEKEDSTAIVGSVLGGLLGLAITILIFKISNEIKKSNLGAKMRFEQDPLLDGFDTFLFLIIAFIINALVSILVLIGFFGPVYTTEFGESIRFLCFLVIMYSYATPCLSVFFSNKLNMYNPLVRYGLILIGIVICFTALIEFWIPALINILMSITSLSYLFVSNSKKSSR